MCAIYDQYSTIYFENIGKDVPRAKRRVRMARLLIIEHKRTCPECRPCHEHTTYNLTPPRVLVHNRPGARGGKL